VASKPALVDLSESESSSSSSSIPPDNRSPKRVKTEPKDKGKMRSKAPDSSTTVQRALDELAQSIMVHQTTMQVAFNGIVSAVHKARKEIAKSG
jgi:hypothetical protein